MLTLEAGPDGVFPPGSVRVVSDKDGKARIDGKFAELASRRPSHPGTAEEYATSELARVRETAVPPRGKPGPRSSPL